MLEEAYFLNGVVTRSAQLSPIGGIPSGYVDRLAAVDSVVLPMCWPFIDLRHAVVGIAGKAHFIACQFRHPGQARASLRQKTFRWHRFKRGVPDTCGLVI